MTTPENITKLKKNEIFVFGSNLNGNHAGGAALQAVKFGAQEGVGEGLTGQAYAFPTLDKNMKKVSSKALASSVTKLYVCAVENPDKTFYVTKVGCGIAGFTEEEMKTYFQGDKPDNVILPEGWLTRWKFLREGMVSDYKTFKWKPGKWYSHKGTVKLCDGGFHSSKEIGQAFSYIQGEVLALVEVSGSSDSEDDKDAWEHMRVIKAYKWQKKDSVAIAIYAAELCIDNYEKVYPNEKAPRLAIEAAKKYLKNPTEKNRLACETAWSAAESAARSAESAARSAAWSAESAAESAAWPAAESAARSARSAAWSAESAAESAAWPAAESAAWSAAESAARSAESAALKKIYARFEKQLKELEEIK
jgi:hypothetical protein